MFVAQVRRTIAERRLIGAGQKVLVACSGGPDSAALLGALAALAPELGVSLEAASVDHGLRPEAGTDVLIAARQAARVGVPFHALQIRVARGASLQAQARSARYAALLQLAQERGAARVAVGHTLDDQAETVLLRILRGAGVRGLGAIAPQRADGVIRPLIDCERASAHAFARSAFVEIAEDPSNHDPRHERVRIRERVLPGLAEEAPAIARRLAELAEQARQVQEVLELAADDLLAAARIDECTLARAVLAEKPEALRAAALQRFIEPRLGKPLARAHLVQLEHAVRAARGEIWLPNGLRVTVHADGRVVLETGPGRAPARHL